MAGEDMEIMKRYLDHAVRWFKLLVAAVAALEFVLMIWGLLFFDLERLKLRMYLYSYIFLLVTSLAALLLLHVFGYKEKHFRKTLATVHLYAFCIIMWSAGVTSIDCYANGDSGIVVYVITCISVGVLTLLRPWVFLCYLLVSSTFLLTVTAAMRGWELYSTGFYLNFAVFFLMAIFINSHNYRLSLREYRAKKTLERYSETDPLTGLYNRRRLDRYMEETAGQEPFVLIVLDVDKFKQVNDCFGHTVGDVCLEKVAYVLVDHFGEQVYRMGGDEFAIVSAFDMAETCSHMDAINRELAGLIEQLPLYVSAGIYAFRAGDNLQEALHKADKALYRVKNAGGAGWTVYE